jgi:hypothetical protein
MADVTPLVLIIFDEFDVTLPSQSEAAWIKVRTLAEDILSGGVDPLGGAHMFWFLYTDCDQPPELGELLGILDYWESGTGPTRAKTAADILACAPAVVAAADRHLYA